MVDGRLAFRRGGVADLKLSQMMTSRIAVAVVVMLAAATSAFAASGFEAGQWQHQTKLVSAKVPGAPESLVKLVAGHGARTSCNSAAELKAHPEALMTGDPKATCKLHTLTMSKGKLVYDTFCTNQRFPDGLRVVSRGTYTPDSYSISTTSTGMKGGKPVRILTTGAGKHVSKACSRL